MESAAPDPDTENDPIPSPRESAEPDPDTGNNPIPSHKKSATPDDEVLRNPIPIHLRNPIPGHLRCDGGKKDSDHFLKIMGLMRDVQEKCDQKTQFEVAVQLAKLTWPQRQPGNQQSWKDMQKKLKAREVPNSALTLKGIVHYRIRQNDLDVIYHNMKDQYLKAGFDVEACLRAEGGGKRIEIKRVVDTPSEADIHEPGPSSLKPAQPGPGADSFSTSHQPLPMATDNIPSAVDPQTSGSKRPGSPLKPMSARKRGKMPQTDHDGSDAVRKLVQIMQSQLTDAAKLSSWKSKLAQVDHANDVKHLKRIQEFRNDFHLDPEVDTGMDDNDRAAQRQHIDQDQEEYSLEQAFMTHVMGQAEKEMEARIQAEVQAVRVEDKKIWEKKTASLQKEKDAVKEEKDSLEKEKNLLMKEVESLKAHNSTSGIQHPGSSNQAQSGYGDENTGQGAPVGITHGGTNDDEDYTGHADMDNNDNKDDKGDEDDKDDNGDEDDKDDNGDEEDDDDEDIHIVVDVENLQ